MLKKTYFHAPTKTRRDTLFPSLVQGSNTPYVCRPTDMIDQTLYE
jgi:hypothetical protein